MRARVSVMRSGEVKRASAFACCSAHARSGPMCAPCHILPVLQGKREESLDDGPKEVFPFSFTDMMAGAGATSHKGTERKMVRVGGAPACASVSAQGRWQSRMLTSAPLCAHNPQEIVCESKILRAQFLDHLLGLCPELPQGVLTQLVTQSLARPGYITVNFRGYIVKGKCGV